MIIALDTNFLVYCMKQRIDFLHETDRLCSSRYSIIVPEQIVAELKKLSNTKNRKDKGAAVLALQLIKKYENEGKIGIKRVKAENADSALLNFDKEGNAIATLDAALKKRVKRASILTIRQLKHLEFI
jgi:rRNA-processing protein FCF1